MFGVNNKEHGDVLLSLLLTLGVVLVSSLLTLNLAFISLELDCTIWKVVLNESLICCPLSNFMRLVSFYTKFSEVFREDT